MLTEEVVTGIKKAITMFGTYTLFDKGLSEVYDITKVTDYLRSLSGKDANTYIKELINKCDDILDGTATHNIISELIVSVDDQPDSWWIAFIADIEHYY